MNEQRAILKRAIIAKLDAIAAEHPAGHQAAYARRYSLTGKRGGKLEVMFEQSPVSPPHIWFLFSALGVAANSNLGGIDRPEAELWKKRNKKGELAYGRHTALLAMPQLKSADLVRFTPKTIGEASAIIDALLTSPALN